MCAILLRSGLKNRKVIAFAQNRRSPERLSGIYETASEKFGCGGRVTVGHVTKMSTISPERFFAIAQRLANVGVAVTVLPSTDLYLMGRHQDHSIIRGVTPVHKLIQRSVT